jgi:ligand-binding sensor domain-containing protein
MKYKVLILLIAFNSLYLTGYSQGADWLNFTITDSPQSFVVDNSDIWACSSGGIVRINKETGETINYNHASSFLHFNPIWVFIDSNEQLWFYDSKHIGLFKNDHWDSINIAKHIGKNEYLHNLIVSGTNRVYLSIDYSNTVYELIDDSLHHLFTLKPPFPDNRVADLATNSKEELLIAGYGSVTRLTEFDTIVYDSDNSPIPDGYITDIFVDSKDNLWIIPESYSGDTALVRFNGTEWTYWLVSDFDNYSLFFDPMVEDNNGVLYLSSYRGIFSFEDEIWNKYDEIGSDGLSVDKENNLWSLSKPYVKLKTVNGWKNYDLKTNELDSITNHCICNYSGSVYIGGENQVSAYDGTDWKKFTGIDEVTQFAISNEGIAMALTDGEVKVSSDIISWQKISHSDLPINKPGYHKIFVDVNNDFWIATNNGLFHYENNELNKALDFRINDIDQDGYGNLWLATENGLIKYKDGIIDIYNQGNTDLASDFVSHLSIGSNDEIWLSVQKIIEDYPYSYAESYLTKFENDVFENYDTLCCVDSQDALYFNSGFLIDRVIAGGKNEVWVNYSYKGLMHLIDGTFSLYNYQNSGLPDNKINDFLIDSDTNIFIVHDRALSVFNQNGITLKVQESGNERKPLFIYPNPSHGNFFIRFNRIIHDKVQVDIFDLTGREVRSGTRTINSDRLNLHLPDLVSGLYFYQVRIKNETFSGKLLIFDN